MAGTRPQRTGSVALSWSAARLYDVGPSAKLDGELPGARIIIELPAGPAPIAVEGAPSAEAAPASKTPPTEFPVFKAGINSTVKGDFLFDDEAAALVMAAWQSHGVEGFIDYDHQATMPGVQAKAAGWYGLDVRRTDAGPELWAVNVRWTPAAMQAITDKEYRYFSPWLDFAYLTDGVMRITALRNLALTNYPATRNMAPLVASAALAAADTPLCPPVNVVTLEASNMQKCTACGATLTDQAYCPGCAGRAMAAASAALSLTVGTPTDKVLEEVQRAARFRGDVVTLSGAADAPAALGVLQGWKASHAALAAATAELTAMKAERAREKFAAAAATPEAKRKITPGMRTGEWFKGLEAEPVAGLVQLSAFLKTAPDFAPDATTAAVEPGTGADGADQSVVLTAAELAIAQQTGSDPAKVLETKRALHRASLGMGPRDPVTGMPVINIPTRAQPAQK